MRFRGVTTHLIGGKWEKFRHVSLGIREAGEMMDIVVPIPGVPLTEDLDYLVSRILRILTWIIL